MITEVHYAGGHSSLHIHTLEGQVYPGMDDIEFCCHRCGAGMVLIGMDEDSYSHEKLFFHMHEVFTKRHESCKGSGHDPRRSTLMPAYQAFTPYDRECPGWRSVMAAFDIQTRFPTVSVNPEEPA